MFAWNLARRGLAMTRRRAPILLLGAVVVLLLAVVTLSVHEPGRRAQIRASQHTQLVAFDLLAALDEAGAHHLAFLLTNEPADLRDYRTALASLPGLRARLDAATAGSQQAAPASRLDALLDAAMTQFARGTELAQAGNREAALRRDIAETAPALGQIRDLIHRIGNEAGATHDRDAHAGQAQRWLTLALLTSALLLLAVLALVQRRRNQTISQAVAAALAVAEERAEARLRETRESEALLRTVTDTARVGLAIIGPDHCYRFANRAYADLTGQVEIPRRGDSLAVRRHEDYEGRIRASVDRALAGERVASEAAMHGLMGTELRCAVNLEPGADATGLPVAIVVITDLSERIAAMRALMESEARFRNLFERAPISTLLLDLQDDSRVVDCNQAGADMLGYAMAELLGMAIRDIDAELPESRQRMLAQQSNAGIPHMFETRHRRKDGEMRDVLVSVTPLRLGGRLLAHCSVIDITGHKATEAALAAQLRSVLDTVPDALVVSDEASQIVDFSAAAERIFGWRADEVVGTPVRRLVPEADWPQQAARLARWSTDGNLTLPGRSKRITGLRHDGTEFPMEIVMGEARAADGRRLCTAFLRDMTERVRTEQRVQALQSELAHVSRLAAMGTMATMLAHELSQPLTASANFASAARRLLAGTPDAEALAAGREALEEAAAQSVRAGQIVRHLREFLGSGPATRGTEAPGAIVDEAAQLALAGVREQGVAVRIDIADDLPAVRIDRIQVQQVVVNLVRNAVEALQGQPRRELCIAVATEADRRQVVISVADSGPGLAADVAQSLFEPFVTSKRDGMGLGLSICRDIVEAHGGVLSAHVRPEGGMLFRFNLPAATMHQDSMTDAA